MKVIETSLKDCLIIEPEVFKDHRGCFFEQFSAVRYAKQAGIHLNFVQDNYSSSIGGVLRGLHFQKAKPQGKLVYVSRGEVFDVAVDIRRDSITFGQWEAVILSGDNKRQLWVPPGFAHGFVTLSATVDFMYKCTDYYNAEDEAGILWNDRDLAIKWPVKSPELSDKDKNLLTFKEMFPSICKS